MNQGDHERYLRELLTALRRLGEERVRRAEWLLHQDHVTPDLRQEANEWVRSGREIVDRAAWALEPANDAIEERTPGYGHICHFADATTMGLHRAVRYMTGPQTDWCLWIEVQRPGSGPVVTPPELWIPFLLSNQREIEHHTRLIAPWVASIVVQ